MVNYVEYMSCIFVSRLGLDCTGAVMDQGADEIEGLPYPRPNLKNSFES